MVLAHLGNRCVKYYISGPETLAKGTRSNRDTRPNLQLSPDFLGWAGGYWLLLAIQTDNIRTGSIASAVLAVTEGHRQKVFIIYLLISRDYLFFFILK